MERANRGGWLYIMADRYRGGMYVGVTADLARRIHQHRTGTGSAHCAEHGLTRLVWAEPVATSPPSSPMRSG
jgi:putative endonuclease